MKNLKRALALLLAFVMCLSLLPASALAEGSEEACAHALEYVAPVEAGCAFEGCGEYYLCSLCGASFADAQGLVPVDAASLTVPAHGHSPVTDAAVAATPEQPGLTEGSHCQVCGEILTAQTELPYTAPETEAEPEPLYLNILNYSALSEDGTARYIVDAAADTETQLQPETETNGALTYQWQRYDAQAEDEALRWVDITLEENSTAQSPIFVLTPTADMLNVDELFRCAVTAAAEGEEPLTAYALFTLRYEEPAPEEAPEAVLVSSLTLSAQGDATALNVGETLQLSAGVEPENADNKALLWTSSDETLATVDGSGLVTGLAEGLVTITAAATDESGVSASMDLELTALAQGSVELRNATSGDFEYLPINGTASITGYTGTASEITIPTQLDGIPVTGINGSFASRTITVINIPADSALTELTYACFDDCSALQAINVAAGNTAYSSRDGLLYNKALTQLICCPAGRAGAVAVPAGVTRVLRYAFGRTNVSGVTLPGSLTAIEEGAFSNCPYLSYVNIPSGVETIGVSAFSDSPIRNISIPASVTQIDDAAFNHCELSYVNVAADNPNYSSLDGVLFNKDQTTLILFPQLVTGQRYVVPDSVTKIENYAFMYSALTGVEIPATVLAIGNTPFRDSDVTTIYGVSPSYAQTWAGQNTMTFSTDPPALDDSLNFSYIISADGSYATITGYTGSQTALVIPDKLGGKPVKAIGDEAFSDNEDISSVTFPAGLTRIGTLAFDTCSSLSSLVIPQGVTHIGKKAFYSCAALESVSLPASLVSLGSRVFAFDEALSSLTVAADNPYYKAVDSVLFNKAGTELIFCPESKTGSYEIPQGVTHIAEDAFEYCEHLISITIPEGVTDIGAYAFDECSSLTQLTLPASLRRLDISAIEYCSALASISVASGNPVYSSYNDLLLTDGGATLLFCPEAKTGDVVVPEGVTSMADEVFLERGLSSVELPSTLSSISEGAFYGCDSLQDVSLPLELSSIDERAFAECTALQSIDLPQGLISIGDNAFMYCTALQSVSLPQGLKSIGIAAFYECTALQNVSLPQGLQSIGDWAFENCTALQSVSFPQGLKSIGASAFFNCRVLRSVILPSGLSSIGPRAFAFCSGLTTLVLPGSLSSIEDNCFYTCTSLTDVIIPSGVSSIGSWAFAACTALAAVTIPASVKTISGDAFDGCASGLKIYGPAGSAAQAFATEKGFDFEATEVVTVDTIKSWLEGHDSYVLDQDLKLTKNLLIPAEADLEISGGAVLTVPKGITLTVDGYIGMFDGSIVVEAGGKLVNNGDVNDGGIYLEGRFPCYLTVKGSYLGSGELCATMSGLCYISGVSQDKIDAEYIYEDLQDLREIPYVDGYRSSSLFIQYFSAEGSSSLDLGFTEIVFNRLIVPAGTSLSLPACSVVLRGDSTVAGTLNARFCDLLIASNPVSTLTLASGAVANIGSIVLGIPGYGDGKLVVETNGELISNSVIIATPDSTVTWPGRLSPLNRYVEVSDAAQLCDALDDAATDSLSAAPMTWTISLAADITLSDSFPTVSGNVQLYLDNGNLTVDSDDALTNYGVILVVSGKTLNFKSGSIFNNGGIVLLGAQYTSPDTGFLVMNGTYNSFDSNSDEVPDGQVTLVTVGSSVTGANAESVMGSATVFVRSYAELKKAIAQAGTKARTITLTESFALGASLSLPANIALEIGSMSTLTVPKGMTLTVNRSGLLVRGGELVVNGGLTLNSDVNVWDSGSIHVEKTGVLTNNAVLILGSAQLINSNGSLYIDGAYKGFGYVDISTPGSYCYMEGREHLALYSATVTTQQQLIDEVNACRNGSSNYKCIYLGDDIELTQSLILPDNVELHVGDGDYNGAHNLTLSGSGTTLTVNGLVYPHNDSVIRAENGATLTNNGNIYLYYHSDADCGPTLIVDSGATLRNNSYIYVGWDCSLTVNGSYVPGADAILNVQGGSVSGVDNGEKSISSHYICSDDYSLETYLYEYTAGGYKDVNITLDSGSCTVASDVEIPANFTLNVINGCKIIVPANSSLTVNGSLLATDGGVIDVKAYGTLVNNNLINISVVGSALGKLIMNGSYSGDGTFLGLSGLSGTKAAQVKARGMSQADELAAQLSSSDVSIYVDDEFFLGKNLTIPTGKTLSINGGVLYLDSGVTLTVSPGATLKLSSGILCASKGSKLINNGDVIVDEPQLLTLGMLGSVSGTGLCSFYMDSDTGTNQLDYVKYDLSLLGGIKSKVIWRVASFFDLFEALLADLPVEIELCLVQDVSISHGEELTVPKGTTLILNSSLRVSSDSALTNNGLIQVGSADAPGILTVSGSLSGSGTVSIYDGDDRCAVLIDSYGVDIQGPDTVFGGKSAAFTAALSPSNLTNTTIDWRLAEGDENYVTLTKSGNKATLKAKAVTEAHDVTLTAFTKDGCASTQPLTVHILPLTSSLTIIQSGADVSGQTLLLDIEEETAPSSLRLATASAPADALNKVTWSSSNQAVATVSANGLVTGLKPGTVTIKAAATDGSGKSASVKIQVMYIDAAAKLSAVSANDSVPAMGLQYGYKTTMQVFGADKTSPLSSELFEFSIPAAQQAIATVDGNGVITAGTTAGTATVTATLDGDPLKRKVSLSVKVIAPQADSVLLTPQLSDTLPYQLEMLDSSGNVTQRRSQAASYRLILDKALLGTGSGGYTFTIAPTAVYLAPDGQKTESSAVLSFASSDTSLATVTAAKNGTATVTVKRTTTAYGECVITGTAKDLVKASNILTIQIRDYTPRLGSDKLTLNTYLSGGVSVPLLASYGRGIQEVKLYEAGSATPSTRLTADYDGEDNELIVTATEAIPNSTIKAQLKVKCSNGVSYTLPLTITVKSTLPAVTLKQEGKFELFDTDSLTHLKLSSKDAAISNVSIEGVSGQTTFTVSAFNDVTSDATVAYAADPDFSSTWQPYNKVTLKIELVGYDEPLYKTFTIATALTTKPKLALSAAASLVNTGYDGSKTASFYVYNTVTKERLTLEDSDVNITTTPSGIAVKSVVDNSIVLTLQQLDGAYLGGKAEIRVQKDGWALPLTFTHTLSVTNAKPTAKLKAATLTINALFDTSVETQILLNHTSLSFGGCTFAPPAGKEADPNYLKLTALLSDDGVLTVSADPSIAAGTYTLKVTPRLPGGTELNPLTLKVIVKRTLPTAKLSASTVKLNTVYPDVLAYSTLSMNPTGLSFADIICVPTAAEGTAAYTEAVKLTQSMTINPANGELIVRVASNPAPGTYGIKVTPTVNTLQNGGTTVSLKPLTLTVKVEKIPPTAKLQSSTLTVNALYPDAVAKTEIDLSQDLRRISGLGIETPAAAVGKLAVTWDGSALTARVLDTSIKTGSYTFKIRPELDENTPLKPLSLKVTVVNTSNISATVKAANKLDTLYFPSPSNSIFYTITKLNNISGTVSGVSLQGPDADKFSINMAIDLSTNQTAYILSLLDGQDYSTALTYKVQLAFDLGLSSPAAVLTPLLSIKVTQSPLKLSLSKTSASIYQSNVQPLRFSIKLDSPDGAALDKVTVNSATPLALRQALNASSLDFTPSSDGGSLTVTIADASRLKPGVTYPLVLDVSPIGQATNLKPAQLKISIKAYK